MDLELAPAPPGGLRRNRSFEREVLVPPLSHSVLSNIRALPSYWLNDSVSSARSLPRDAAALIDRAIDGSELRRVGPVVGMERIRVSESTAMSLQPFFGKDPSARLKSPNRAFINVGESPAVIEVAEARALKASDKDHDAFGTARFLSVLPGACAIVPVAVLGHRIVAPATFYVIQGFFSA